MRIGPDTRVFISVSATPGRFGATVYNTLFARLGIDAVYIPRPAPPDPADIVRCVRVLGLAGCSVSSPHKAGVLTHLDDAEPPARLAGAVNTIYRRTDGALVGACTDIDGVSGALADVRPMSAVVYGSGGVAGPAIIGLLNIGFRNITVVARNQTDARAMADRLGVNTAPLATAELVINATPAGRDALDAPVLTELVTHARVFLDMPVTPAHTAIVRHARAHGVECRTGVDMCTHQIVAQARRYLGRNIDFQTIRRIRTQDYLAGG